MTAPMFSLDIRGLLSAQEKLQLLALPATKRRRVLKNASQRLATQNRKRTRSQRNLDGTSFAARKGGRKRKMLRGLSKQLKVISATANEAVLGWKSRPASRIASEHQAGRSQTMTAARLRRLGKTPDYNAPASRQQARALLKAGYQIRQGKRRMRPALGWIVEHLSNGQAGLILAQLEGVTKKQSWSIDLPARDALGADARDVRQIVSTVLQQTLNSPT